MRTAICLSCLSAPAGLWEASVKCVASSTLNLVQNQAKCTLPSRAMKVYLLQAVLLDGIW